MPSNWASAGTLAVAIRVVKIRALMTKRIIAAAAAIAIATVVLHTTVQRRIAPDVRFATLPGKPITTGELHGKVVLVNFWATWCASCIKETPKMVATYNKYAPRGYEVVAVAVRGDRPDAVARFARQRELPYMVAVDANGEVAQRFGGVRVTPFSVLIDREGRIVARYTGEPDWAELHAAIERLL
jgi:peroxiredoxin